MAANFWLVCEAAPLPLRRFNPYIPASLEAVVEKCLQKEVAARYPNAQSLCAVLQEVRDSLKARRKQLYVEATLAFSVGNHQKALRLYQQVTAIDPNYAETTIYQLACRKFLGLVAEPESKIVKKVEVQAKPEQLVIHKVKEEQPKKALSRKPIKKVLQVFTGWAAAALLFSLLTTEMLHLSTQNEAHSKVKVANVATLSHGEMSSFLPPLQTATVQPQAQPTFTFVPTATASPTSAQTATLSPIATPNPTATATTVATLTATVAPTQTPAALPPTKTPLPTNTATVRPPTPTTKPKPNITPTVFAKLNAAPAFSQIPTQAKPQSVSPTAVITTTNGLIWPLKGPITTFFGQIVSYGPHEGLDIAPPCGTPAVAADKGTVIELGWSVYGYGYTVLIDHGNGLTTRYGHFAELAVIKGQTVTKGQVVGYEGSTGNSTGCHLHFEVLVNGVPVNPLPLLH